MRRKKAAALLGLAFSALGGSFAAAKSSVAPSRPASGAGSERIELRLPLPTWVTEAGAPRAFELAPRDERALPGLELPRDHEPAGVPRVERRGRELLDRLGARLERGPYLNPTEDELGRALAVDLRAGLEWRASSSLGVSFGYGLAFKASPDAGPADALGALIKGDTNLTPFLRHGPWLAFRGDF